MAPQTPSKAGTKYANPTIQILVGDAEIPFYVHFDRLEKTSFFDRHGAIILPNPTPTPVPSPSRPQSAANSPAPSEATVGGDANIKVEEDATSEAPALPKTPVAMPVYKLRGVLYEPTSFEVIVNFLYNERPATPQHREDLRVLRKSYILAFRYDMEKLQDEIVECFRRFHSRYTIQFDDLLWMVRRVEGDEHAACQVPMVQYLISQCAYEICKYGYDKFAQENHDFEAVLVLGDRPLRKELFRAIVAIPGHSDPATGNNYWRVRDWRPYIPNANREPSLDIIDIDD